MQHGKNEKKKKEVSSVVKCNRMIQIGGKEAWARQLGLATVERKNERGREQELREKSIARMRKIR